jgi:hypothetical protein
MCISDREFFEMPFLVTDLSNDPDMYASIALMQRRLNGGAAIAPDSHGDDNTGGGSLALFDTPNLTERLLANLWPRLSVNVRKVVKQTEEYGPGDWFTIGRLATDLGRDYLSVRATWNSPFSRALNSAKREVPGVELYHWKRLPAGSSGGSFEFTLTEEARAALKLRTVDEVEHSKK